MGIEESVRVRFRSNFRRIELVAPRLGHMGEI